ncbi:hypothetical protein H1Q59_00205 [Holosporaceae bacterium 'Namur']|nr:hypothetical protein [Holosporaceae bacterium 'Namur']
MKTTFLKTVLFVTLVSLLNGCAPDLSSNVYTGDSRLNLTLEGQIASVRPVVIKGSEKLSDNVIGIAGGGAMGAAAGAGIGAGTGQGAAIVGVAIAGAVVGALIQDKLSQANGSEYIVKVDISKLKNVYYEGSSAMRNAISTATTSGLIAVVQSNVPLLQEGQKVYVIFSNSGARITPAL